MRDDCITVALGLRELRVRGEEETDWGIKVQVEYRVSDAECPECGEKAARVHSRKVQVKRDRRLWDKPVYLELTKRRFRCGACGRVFSEPDPVFGMRRRTSQRFRSYLGREAIDQTVRQVARKEGMGESLVRGCVTEEARRLLGAAASPHPPGQGAGAGRGLHQERTDVRHRDSRLGAQGGHRSSQRAPATGGGCVLHRAALCEGGEGGGHGHARAVPPGGGTLLATGPGGSGQVPCAAARAPGAGSGPHQSGTTARKAGRAVPCPVSAAESAGAVGAGVTCPAHGTAGALSPTASRVAAQRVLQNLVSPSQQGSGRGKADPVGALGTGARPCPVPGPLPRAAALEKRDPSTTSISLPTPTASSKARTIASRSSSEWPTATATPTTSDREYCSPADRRLSLSLHEGDHTY